MFRRIAPRVAAPALLGQRTAVTNFTGSLEEFQAATKEGATVVDFYTTWCGPCQHIAPQFTKLSDAAEHQHVRFLKVDVEENDELGAEFEIRSIPTFVLLQDGAKVETVEGARMDLIEGLVTKAKK